MIEGDVSVSIASSYHVIASQGDENVVRGTLESHDKNSRR